MALPMIAAGIAARAVAKKIATRAVGGITGRGSTAVNPVYRNIRATTDAIQKNSVKLVKTQAVEGQTLAISKTTSRNALIPSSEPPKSFGCIIRISPDSNKSFIDSSGQRRILSHKEARLEN